jgi:hypothetical protein
MPDTDADDLEVAATFWSTVADHFFAQDGAELEYDTFLELGTELGLLAMVPYDPALHTTQQDADLETGDMIYWPTDLGARLHALARAGS